MLPCLAWCHWFSSKTLFGPLSICHPLFRLRGEVPCVSFTAQDPPPLVIFHCSVSASQRRLHHQLHFLFHFFLLQKPDTRSRSGCLGWALLGVVGYIGVLARVKSGGCSHRKIGWLCVLQKIITINGTPISSCMARSLALETWQALLPTSPLFPLSSLFSLLSSLFSLLSFSTPQVSGDEVCCFTACDDIKPQARSR